MTLKWRGDKTPFHLLIPSRSPTSHPFLTPPFLFFSFSARLLLQTEKIKVLVVQSCPTLCDHTNCSLPSSSVYGILQARIMKWVAIPFSRGSSQPRDRTWVSCIRGRFFTVWGTRQAPNWSIDIIDSTQAPALALFLFLSHSSPYIPYKPLYSQIFSFWSIWWTLNGILLLPHILPSVHLWK